MTEYSLLPSHPDHQKMSELAQMIAWAVNPQILFGLLMDCQGIENRALIQTLKEEQGKLIKSGLDEQRYLDFVRRYLYE